MQEALKPLILVVDDDEAVCHSLSALLGEGGYSTQTARDGEEALDLAQRERPALIITDLIMPSMDGWEVVVQLRQRGLTIPAILMSGYAKPATNRHVHFLPKPVDPNRLLGMIDEILESRPPDA